MYMYTCYVTRGASLRKGSRAQECHSVVYAPSFVDCVLKMKVDADAVSEIGLKKIS